MRLITLRGSLNEVWVTIEAVVFKLADRVWLLRLQADPDSTRSRDSARRLLCSLIDPIVNHAISECECWSTKVEPLPTLARSVIAAAWTLYA